ncbi:MAG: OmpA family protein [Alistipes sp.]|nr:OmpA family protein [Alistipes sp.]
MKRTLLAIVLALFTLTAGAQETPKKPSCAGFVSNGFWDNWEVSAGLGAGTFFSTGSNVGSFGDRIGFEGNVSATKWVHPVLGLRLQLQGGYFNNFDAQMQSGKAEWPYLFVHTDVMANLSNWIGGYREDRAYYAVLFGGFGYMTGNFTDGAQRQTGRGTTQELAFTYGLLNKFRLSPSVDFNIELKGMVVKSEIAPVAMSGNYGLGFSATAGVSYRFNQRGWQRGVPGYTADDIRAFQQAVADGKSALDAANAENARMAAALEAARKEAEAAKKAAAAAKAVPVKTVETPATTILYDYGTSKLTAKEKTRLDLMADLIKNGPKNKVYTIEGHADYQTGTAAGNQRVSENRAKNVYDYLVSKGVDPKQLTYEGKGDQHNPYQNNQKANRAAVIR